MSRRMATEYEIRTKSVGLERWRRKLLKALIAVDKIKEEEDDWRESVGMARVYDKQWNLRQPNTGKKGPP